MFYMDQRPLADSLGKKEPLAFIFQWLLWFHQDITQTQAGSLCLYPGPKKGRVAAAGRNGTRPYVITITLDYQDC